MTASAYHWVDRAEALLQMARDVAPHPRLIAAGDQVPEAYRPLFDRYVADMRRAMQGAYAWWTAMVDTEEQRCGDRARAESEVAERNPVGPVADRGVIAVLRHYWLACSRLSTEVDASEAVAPEEFLLASLIGSAHEDIAQFISQLPYWPIGMTADGMWV